MRILIQNGIRSFVVARSLRYLRIDTGTASSLVNGDDAIKYRQRLKNNRVKSRDVHNRTRRRFAHPVSGNLRSELVPVTLLALRPNFDSIRVRHDLDNCCGLTHVCYATAIQSNCGRELLGQVVLLKKSRSWKSEATQCSAPMPKLSKVAVQLPTHPNAFDDCRRVLDTE